MKRIKSNKKNIINVVNNTIGIISGFFGIVEYITSNTIIKSLFLVFASIYIGFLIYKVASYIKNYIDAKQEYIERTIEVGKYLHKFEHNIRDDMGFGDEEISNRDFFINLCKSICNDTQSVIASLLDDDKVSVSIKKIITDEFVDTNYLEWQVETIARCSKSDPKRDRDSSPKYISENSYLEIIVSPDYVDTVFVSQNLINITTDFIKFYNKQYTNSTKNYLKYYKSTIVVPIRIEASKIGAELAGTLPNNLQYYVIGFLCIDSLKTYDDSQLFYAAEEFSKTIADSIYKLFEKNIIAVLNKEARGWNTL